MRIKCFTYLIKEHLQPYELRNTTVVVDGQNIFYSLYNNSDLPILLGSECDKYAQYVRNYLGMFKRNNLKCLFVVKGGHENEHSLKVHYEMPLVDGSILRGPNKGKPIQPVLAKDIFLEILKEMDFDFTICDTDDVIKICFDLARRLSCPVVSFNIQYSFGPAPYIPLPQGTQIEPYIFEREHFLKTYKITLEKMILFIILTDINIFDEYLFLPFFTSAMIPTLPHIIRYKGLLKWLSRRNLADALRIISEYISEANKKKIVDVTEELKEKFLTSNKEESAALLYFTDRSRLEFTSQDPLWFQKGVALKYIAIPYINAYHWSHVCSSRLVEDYDEENTIILSADIIKYGFDLLKNFNGKNINIIYRSSTDVKQELLVSNSLSKPKYKAVNCVFENGWSNIDSRKLFEHFFIEKLDSFNFDALKDAPEDAKILIIAMVYFTRNKEVDVEDQMCSTMLSYVLLGVIADKIATDEGTAKITFSKRHRASRSLLDNITDKDLVTTEDCNTAKHILGVYQHVEETEIHAIFSRRKVHPLLQFERCLQEINYLNQLCGSPYAPTRYSKTYSATFVYKFIDELDSEDAVQSIRNILSPAATVLAFTSGLIEIYKKILYHY